MGSFIIHRFPHELSTPFMTLKLRESQSHDRLTSIPLFPPSLKESNLSPLTDYAYRPSLSISPCSLLAWNASCPTSVANLACSPATPPPSSYHPSPSHSFWCLPTSLLPFAIPSASFAFPGPAPATSLGIPLFLLHRVGTKNV